jgi:hypothetical protein
LIAIAAFSYPGALCAQFTDPRTYTNAPVGLNQLEAASAYAHADASVDTSLVIGGASLDLYGADVAYTHNFGVLGHFAWAKATVPFATLRGSVAGTNISGSTTGTGDISLELAGLLIGGPALGAAEFETYEPTTTLGIGLTVTAPTGEYHPNKLLNLGSDRWSFKPELAVSHPFGPEQKWEIDAYINAYFFTDNSEYKGVEILRQEPLPGLEGHLSYSFTPSVWASLDARYSFRGETLIDGLAQNDSQESLVMGTEVNWSPNSHHSLDLVFAKALVHENAPTNTAVTLKYVYSWGRGYK